MDLERTETISVDNKTKVNVVQVLTLNPVTGNLERATGIQGNHSIALGYDGLGNVVTVTKSVGGTDYVKTLTYDEGKITGVSEWV